MSAIEKQETPGITIDPNMQDYRNDPYFLKKAEKARAFIKKHGLPKKEQPKKGK